MLRVSNIGNLLIPKFFNSLIIFPVDFSKYHINGHIYPSDDGSVFINKVIHTWEIAIALPQSANINMEAQL